MQINSLDDLRKYCKSKAGVKEDFPFDQNTLVFKVMNKIFALTNITWSKLKVNLKCDPEFAELLREKYEAIIPGYHMNKKHWNTITLDGSVPNNEILQLIDHSYDLVVSKLKKSDREKLAYKDYLNKLD